MTMELGVPFKHTIRIDPGEEGSFVVHVLRGSNGLNSTLAVPTYGFTTIDDLLIWMARHGAKAHVTEMREDDCIDTPDGRRFRAQQQQQQQQQQRERDRALAYQARLDDGAGVIDYGKEGDAIDYNKALGGALCGMDALNGLKRTTAAKTLAERVEAMGCHPGTDCDDPRHNPNDAA